MLERSPAPFRLGGLQGEATERRSWVLFTQISGFCTFVVQRNLEALVIDCSLLPSKPKATYFKHRDALLALEETARRYVEALAKIKATSNNVNFKS